MAHDPSRPWTALYEPGVEPELSEIDEAFGEIWNSAAAQSPGRPALAADNRGVRYSELDALVSRVAASLARDGTGPGERVLVALPPGLHFVTAALAAWRAGAELVPVDPAREGADLAALADDLRPAVALLLPPAAGTAAATIPEGRGTIVEVDPLSAQPRLLRMLARLARPGQRPTRPRRGAVAWSRWLARRAADEMPRVAAGDAALLHVMGGRDSDIPFRHRQLVAGARQLSGWLVDAMPGTETWLSLLDHWSPAGLVVGLGAAYLQRARLALLSPATGDDVVDALRFLRPTYVFSTAAQAAALLAVPQVLGRDLRSVRAWLVTDPMAEDLVQQFEEMSGLEPCLGLALPCAAGLVTCCPIVGERPSASVGLPLPSLDVRVTGPDGSDAKAGEVGWLQLRGPNVAPPERWRDTRLAVRQDASGFVFVASGPARP